MMDQPFSGDTTKLNFLKNLEDIDDIFNGIQEDGVDMDQDFEEFLECFSEEGQEQLDDSYRALPSIRNVSPSFAFSTFADSENSKKLNNRGYQPVGDHQYPFYDDHEAPDDSVQEEDEMSGFFESFEQEEPIEGEIQYIEIKYFEENYKIPVFNPKLFEGEEDIEDRLIFQNSELVLSHKLMNEFQFYISQMNLLKTNRDYTLQYILLKNREQLLRDICLLFKSMKDIQIHWMKLSPSVISTYKFNQFNLQLKQFVDYVNLFLDSASNKLNSRHQFHLQKPAYFQNEKKKTTQLPELTEEEKINQLQQIPYHQTLEFHSSLASLLYFKAEQLYTMFSHFLHYRKKQEVYKRLTSKQKLIRDIFKLYLLFKHKITFVPKKARKELPLLETTATDWIQFGYSMRNMRPKGLVDGLTKSYTTLYAPRQTADVRQIHKVKYCSQQYQQFNQFL